LPVALNASKFARRKKPACSRLSEVNAGGDKPILVAGEEAGLELAFGCRMGICHTCVGRFRSGKVRDLRSGEGTEVKYKSDLGSHGKK